jgi:hypothetical protein
MKKKEAEYSMGAFHACGVDRLSLGQYKPDEWHIKITDPKTGKRHIFENAKQIRQYLLSKGAI